MQKTLGLLALAAATGLSSLSAFAQNAKPDAVIDHQQRIVTLPVKSMVDGREATISKIVDCTTGSMFIGKLAGTGYGTNSALTVYPHSNQTFRQAQEICKNAGMVITP